MKNLTIRIYPNQEQEHLIWRHIGACRFIWNWSLEKQITEYDANMHRLGSTKICKELTVLKQQEEYRWLQDISITSLQQTIRELDRAFNDWFTNNRGYPKFKKKKYGKQSYPVESRKFYFVDDTVQIARLGRVKYKSSYIFPQGNHSYRFRNVRILYDNNKWKLSLCVDDDFCETQVKKKPLNDYKMGIDLGVKVLCSVAVGSKHFEVPNINKTKRVKNLESRLKHLHRCQSRKYNTNGNFEKTKNILKTEDKIRKVYYKLKKIRKNYTHQTTTYLVNLYPCKVVMEDLNIMGMIKNRHLSKAISDQYLYEFRTQMEYKCRDRGIEFVLVNRFFSSSKTCSCCGAIKTDLKLSDRVYVCKKCGLIIDRDCNAAINLMNYSKD